MLPAGSREAGRRWEPADISITKIWSRATSDTALSREAPPGSGVLRGRVSLLPEPCREARGSDEPGHAPRFAGQHEVLFATRAAPQKQSPVLGTETCYKQGAKLRYYQCVSS